MANRLVGNIIIVDSAMGNSFLIPDLGKLKVNAISLWSVDTTSNITLTGANTATDLIYKFDFLTGGGGSTSAPNPIHFSSPQCMENLKVPRLTAGTALIYLA